MNVLFSRIAVAALILTIGASAEATPTLCELKLKGLKAFGWEQSAQIDKAFGLDIAKMDAEIDQVRDNFGDEEIWYAPGAGQQTPWHYLGEILGAMKLQPGQTVVDLGSGVGRIGLAIGLLHPEVKFIGLELVEPRVNAANAAARASHFSNVKYKAANLALAETQIPEADVFYMFNPFTTQTADIVADKLIALSKTKKFKVVLLTGISTQRFYDYFKKTGPHTYETP